MPRETAPSHPQKPWTEIAPQGSSIFSTRSFKSTPMHTTTPATIPMMAAEVGFTNAQGAVIATSPANIPLQAIVMSGFPNRNHQKNIADAEPKMAARFVLIATTEMRRSVAPSVEPGLNPIQPKRRMKVPTTTKARLWAGNALGFPSGPYFPIRGPRTTAKAIAANPPTACTTVDPAKSTYPCPQPMELPSCDIHPPPHTQF